MTLARTFTARRAWIWPGISSINSVFWTPGCFKVLQHRERALFFLGMIFPTQMPSYWNYLTGTALPAHGSDLLGWWERDTRPVFPLHPSVEDQVFKSAGLLIQEKKQLVVFLMGIFPQESREMSERLKHSWWYSHTPPQHRISSEEGTPERSISSW